jgi:hypothetical protein
MLSEGIQ